MSSKGHIIWSKQRTLEAYNETNESRCDFMGTFIGFDIYLLIDHSVCEVNIEKGKISIKINKIIDYELGFFPSEVIFDAYDIVSFESDFEGIIFVIKAGTEFHKRLETSFKGESI